MDRKMILNEYLKETGYDNVNLTELFKTWSTDMLCDKYNISLGPVTSEYELMMKDLVL